MIIEPRMRGFILFNISPNWMRTKCKKSNRIYKSLKVQLMVQKNSEWSFNRIWTSRITSALVQTHLQLSFRKPPSRRKNHIARLV
jgi:hypothetical protein